MIETTGGDDVPVTLLCECVGAVVKVEVRDGATYEGTLAHVDAAQGNVELTEVRERARDSSLAVHERVVLRGANVRLLHLPAATRKAPLLAWRSASVVQALRRSLKRARHAKAARKRGKLPRRVAATTRVAADAVDAPPREQRSERQLRKLRR